MTEVTNRPPDPTRTAAADEATLPYSSVSPLAIIGFVVAVGYSAVIGVGSLIALFYRTPWVLPLWSLVFPSIAIVVCWAARSGIASSEGTLTGRKLTTWGLYLSFGFGLLYAAYYAACYLSISQMATGFADEWLEDLKTDQVDKAFLLTVAPPRPNADANLRNRIELDYDRTSQGPGKFSEFRRSQLVRQFEQGDVAQVQFLGVQDWSYEAGGYKVDLAYRVATAVMTSELQIQVIGVENSDDAGRQWFVKDYHQVKKAPTAENERRSAENNQAHEFAQKWLEKAAEWKMKEAYKDTLPPSARMERVLDSDDGLKKFREGSLIRADAATFWAAERDRAKVIADIQSLFGHGGQNPGQLTLLNAPPTCKRDAEQVHIGFDFIMSIPPDMAVQGRLVVARDASVAEPTPDDWRIEALELFSAKAEVAPPGRPPGNPGTRPAGAP